MQPLRRILQWLLRKRCLCWTLASKKNISGSGKPPVYNYEPIMIDMVLTRSVITQGMDTTKGIPQASTKFTLPLLTILPINSLAVETVDINFEMEVKSSFSEDDNQAKESETTGEGSFETKIGWGLLSTTIKGSASYSSKILRAIIHIMRRAILPSIR